MVVEIWSDVMCPFCYIGKRKFERALEEFPHAADVKIIWKSFQLDPDLITAPEKNMIEFLAAHKGVSLAESKEMHRHVTALAAEVGLEYNFDVAAVANSFDAHRFSHLALAAGKQSEAEERLFAAHFTEGKNTADAETLKALGAEIGLNPDAVLEMLRTDNFADDVRADIDEAHAIGVRGVPFFLFDRKYTVSGAQEPATFLLALNTAQAASEPMKQ